MPTELYRQLAFQIDYFYKENGYINVADFITFLGDDIDSIKAIGDITNLDLSDEVNYDAIDDYLNNIREYNEKQISNIYKNKIAKEVNLEKRIELANKKIEYKRRREQEYDRWNKNIWTKKTRISKKG